MSMSDRVRSRSPKADRELLEYIDRRRRVQARQRRQLILLGTFAAVGLTALAITAASLFFYNRRPASAPAATVATAPPVQPTPAPAAPPAPATPAPTAPAVQPTAAPQAPEASADAAYPSAPPPPSPVQAVEPDPSLPPPPSAQEPRPAVRESATAARPTVRESATAARSAVRETASAPRPAVRESATESPAGADPAQRTADWLVRTYGRLEAENRALVVAEFYSGDRRAFWRRVAAGVRETAER